MATVITDKTDIRSIEEIFLQFSEEDQIDIYSSKMSLIERAIVFNNLQISDLVIQKENNIILFILNNSTIIQRQISDFKTLAGATEKELVNFENMGNGIIWPAVPSADVSLKGLLQEELALKYKLGVA